VGDEPGVRPPEAAILLLAGEDAISQLSKFHPVDLKIMRTP
jgi:hypothetical protein